MKKILFLLIVLTGFQSILMAQSAISVNTSGQGDPILFLPGFATPGEVWEPVIAQLPDYQSHAVTYAGFGGIAPVEMPWYNKLKTDLIEYVKNKQLKKLTIVGHSMGGNLALDLASSLPENVVKVLVVDALPCMREVMMPGVPAEALAYESPYNEQLLAMDETAQSSYLDQMTKNMISNPQDQLQVKSWMMAADRKTFVYGYVDLLKLDSRPILSSIKAPVLLLVAGQPYGTDAIETMKKQYEQLPNKRFVLAKDSRHYVMLDQPEWFNQQLKALLSQ
ncbi:alpha/beta fold hydrolase [Algoriphagus formosus]|uniref:Alpha/beta hydrolase n=1 Tax=Algoriphagus formosus TaxID=2007308 RepID=A0A4R5VEI3_9BACT|nr:alpha/beta hydrolase [Algoriphagus aquimaris]TDK50612.1 alpha/beta hydrolase [Algoriphagus aquimaris]